ncbi:ATP-binding protein [Streptomyces cellulosae]
MERTASKADQSVAERLAPGARPVRTAGVDAATCVPFARQIAAGVAEWLPGYAEQIDNGSYPAEVSALETDVRAMAHLIHASEAGVNAEPPKPFKAMADRAIAAGHGGEQYPVLIVRLLAVTELRSRGIPQDLTDRAELVVANLAVNAVLHGRVPGLCYRLTPAFDPAADRLRTKVSDARGDLRPLPFPAGTEVDPLSVSGRGQALVAALADR